MRSLSIRLGISANRKKIINLTIPVITGLTTITNLFLCTLSDNAMLYYVVTSSATPIAANDIKTAALAADIPQFYAGFTGSNTGEIKGYPTVPGTYYLHIVPQGSSGVLPAVGLVSSFSTATTDTTPPEIANLVYNLGNITADVNETSTVYYMYSTTATPISAESIKSSAIAASPVQSIVVPTGVVTGTLTGVPTVPGTYYLHMVPEDISGNKPTVGDVVTFVVEPEATPIVLAARIPANTVDGRGYVVEIDVLDANAGTIDPTKITISTSTPSFGPTGSAVAMTRLIKAAHENAALRDLNSRTRANVSIGGVTTYEIVLSDWVYSNDTAVELIVGANWIPGARSQTISCTNSSPVTPLAPTLHWMTPPRRKLARSVEIFEVTASSIMDSKQSNGRTMAALLFTATGATSGLTVSTYVTDLTISTLYSTPATCPPAMVYAASLDFSGFTVGETVTVNCTGYGWIGGSTSSTSSPTLSFAPQSHRIDPEFSIIYCEVNPSAGTAGGTASTNPATVVAGNNFGTVLNTAATLRNTLNGELSYANVVMYISENECIRTAATDRTGGILGPVITRRAGTTKSLCRIKKDGNFITAPHGSHFEDITFTDTADNRTMFSGSGTSRTYTVLNCDLDLTVTNATPEFTDAICYVINCVDWNKPTRVMRQTITGGSGSAWLAWNGVRIHRNALINKQNAANLPGIHRWNCYVADEAGGGTGTGMTISAFPHNKLVSVINCIIADTAANLGDLVSLGQTNHAYSGLQFIHFSVGNRRMNAFYSDTGTIASLSATSICEQNHWIYCNMWEMNHKTELYIGGATVVNNGIRMAYGYKVGFHGNLWRNQTNQSGMGLGGSTWDWGGPVRAEFDRRGRASGSGVAPTVFNSDFTLLSDSAAASDANNITLSSSGGAPETVWTKNIARDMVPAGQRAIPFDIFGNTRLNDGTGAAGAFERPI